VASASFLFFFPGVLASSDQVRATFADFMVLVIAQVPSNLSVIFTELFAVLPSFL